MNDTQRDWSVDIHENGRSGKVVYREAAGSVSCHWEFGGGDTMAILYVGEATAWRQQHAWAIDRRNEILQRIAREVIRQKAPGCRAEIDEAHGWINLQPATSPTQRLPAPPPSIRVSEEKSKILFITALVLMVGALATWGMKRALSIRVPHGAPLGDSVRASDEIATLIQTLESYAPSLPEAARDYKPKSWLTRANRPPDAKEQRRFHRGQLGPELAKGNREVLSMTPLSNDEYLNAAFVRSSLGGDPLRLSTPEGFLMVFTSAPGLAGTLVAARVNAEGKLACRVDTGIDRFKLSQILPDARYVAFVGTRPAVPDKVPEPILVLIDTKSGALTTSTLWK